MLRFDRVSFRYPGRDPVLSDLTFTAKPGERIVVAGRSGSGKTTLLRLAAGLLEPASGELEFEGAWPVGFVRQQPENQLIAGSVREEIAFSLEYAGLPSEEIQRQVEEILRETSLVNLAERPPSQLSGGQMQRVAVAAALAAKPPLWLLDEPTAYLDPEGRRYVHDLFQSLPGDTVGFLVASDASEYELGSRLLLLSDGELIADDTPEALFASGRLEQAGLSLPRARRLADPRPMNMCRTAPQLPEEGEATQPAVFSAEAPNALCKQLVLKGVRASRKEFLGRAGEVIRDVDLAVEPGEVLAVIGNGGAGKTSLLEVMAGTLKPDAGTVLWDEAEPRALRGRIGIAFQFPERSFFAESVLEEVAYGAQNRGMTEAEAKESAVQALRRLGLPTEKKFLARSPFRLAGGEARRVALAAVAAMHPVAWLLDEPTAGLDEQDAELVGDLVREEAAKGNTVVVAGHDVDRFGDWTDRWLVLGEGRVLFDGDPRSAWASGGLPGYTREPATVTAWKNAGWKLETMPGMDMKSVHEALHSRRK